MAAIFCLGLNVLILHNIQFNIEKQYKPVLGHIYIYISGASQTLPSSYNNESMTVTRLSDPTFDII